MEFLQRDLNIIANDKERMKRKKAIERVSDAISQDNSSSSQASGSNADDAASSSKQLDPPSITAIVRTCVRSLEDPSEVCRSAAVELLEKLLPRLGDDGLDWLLPVIATRMTQLTGDSAEPSETQRLDVFNLGMKTMLKYKHDFGPRGFVSTIADIIGAALKDKFPDLLKAACKACVTLCECEPKGVKHFTLPLCKLVKLHGLQHKHSSIRVEAVNAFSTLVAHGAVEILGDMKEEVENRTCVFYISVLSQDHTDSVRRATLKMVERFLTDILDRLEQHRRFVPIVLALLSDTAEDIRSGALKLMEMMGHLYKIDHEDNRIDLQNRRVTVKDMEWYADDDESSKPDMKMNFKSQFDLPNLTQRPGLGARLVVAECVRHFLDKVLSDLTAVDWLIPFSNISRRLVSLRVLHMIFWFCESNVVQHAEPILGSLFKTLLHEDAPVRRESQCCVELLGKYLKPQFYLPILLRRDKNAEVPLIVSADAASATSATSAVSVISSINNDDANASPTNNKKSEEGDADTNDNDKVTTTVVKKGSTTVTTTVMDADADPHQAPIPTLFQCAAATTKRGILTALRCLLLGTVKTLEAPHAKQLVQALTDPDILDLDQPQLVQALCEAIEGLIDVLSLRQFIASPEKPLPESIRDRADQRTLDSMLFVVLLNSLSCPEPSVGKNVRVIIERCSTKVTGTKTGWFDIHTLRILTRHAATLSPEPFAELLNKTNDLSRLGEVLTNLFVTRLSNVNYQLRVVTELRLLGELRKVLGAGNSSSSSSSNNNNNNENNNNGDAAASAVSSSNNNSNSNIVRAVQFNAEQLELLIRSVILSHIRFVPGHTSHLFNKVALQCLREVLRPQRRNLLGEAFGKPWEEVTNPRETPTPLSEKVIGAWLTMIDNDDSECRVTAVEMIYDICMMPLTPGLASEALVHMLNCLDDNLDPIRLLLVQQMYQVLTTNDDDISTSFVNEVRAQVATMTKRFLLHLDDHRENIGIKSVLCDLLKRMCGINCQIVHTMTREVRSKHTTPQYCDEVLAFTPKN